MFISVTLCIYFWFEFVNIVMFISIILCIYFCFWVVNLVRFIASNYRVKQTSVKVTIHDSVIQIAWKVAEKFSP
jgi:hypothetical protein